MPPAYCRGKRWASLHSAQPTVLSKTGPAHLRAMLYMAAVVATRYNRHAKTLSTRLQAWGKCKMAALGAAMRKLVHLWFGGRKPAKPIGRITARSVDEQGGIYRTYFSCRTATPQLSKLAARR